MSKLRNMASAWSARISLLALLGLAVPCHAVTPLPFTPNNPLGGAPIGFAYAGNKFVGTILDNGTGQNLLYSTNLTGTGVTPFAPAVILNPNYGQEHYVSSSLGLGGFPNRDVYVASGNNIDHISNTGTPLGLVVGGSGLGINGDVRGITFDAVGTFGYNMIVTTHTGYVYKIDNAGNPTQLAYTGEDTEGLDIAPVGPGAHWGSLDGALFVASEGTGTVRAIKPTNAPGSPGTTVAFVPSAEQLDFVPLNLGASGSPLEGMYSANYALDVLKAPYTDFTGYLGDIIVTGETTSAISRVNAPFSVSNVGSFPNQPEDGLFVTAAIIAGADTPEPATLGLLVTGGLALLGRRRRA